MSKPSRSSRIWFLTLNNYTVPEYASFVDYSVQGNTSWLCIGKHIGEKSKLPHIHVTFVTHKKITFSTLKSLFPRADIQTRKGTAEQARDYLNKENQLEEYGVMPKTPGDSEKARWAEARKSAEQGEFSDIPPDIYVKYHGNLHRIHSEVMPNPPPRDTLDNWWFYGPTGTGKSFTARKENPGAYIKNKNKWWDGYKGEDCVIIDEWEPGDEKYLAHHLKLWADHYAFTAEVKGSSRSIRPARIIVTSNWSLDQCFMDPNNFGPMERRFQVKHFSELVK